MWRVYSVIWIHVYIYIYIIIIYVCYSLSVASALWVLHIPYTVDSIIKNIRDGPFTIPIMNDVMVAIYSYVFRPLNCSFLSTLRGDYRAVKSVESSSEKGGYQFLKKIFTR